MGTRGFIGAFAALFGVGACSLPVVRNGTEIANRIPSGDPSPAPIPPVEVESMFIKDTATPGVEVHGDDQKELWFKVGGKDFYITLIETLPKDSKTFHWGYPNEIDRWVSQGKVDSGEIDFLVDHGGGAAGGGLYASLDPSDSMQYGTDGVAFTLSQSVRLLNNVGRKNGSVGTISYREEQGAFFTFPYDRIPLEFCAASGLSTDSEGKKKCTQQGPPIHFSVNELRKLSISGIHYTDTWINWISANATDHVERLSTEYFLTQLCDRLKGYAPVFDLNERLNLTASPLFTNCFPLLGKVLKDQPLTSNQDEILFKQTVMVTRSGAPALLEYHFSDIGWTLLREKFVQHFKARLIKELWTKYEKTQSEGLTISRAYGLRGQDWIPGHQTLDRGILKNGLEDDRSNDPSLKHKDLTWVKNFSRWSNTPHPYVVLSAMAHNDAEPWKREIEQGSGRIWLTFLEETQTNAKVFPSSLSKFETAYARVLGHLPDFRDSPILFDEEFSSPFVKDRIGPDARAWERFKKFLSPKLIDDCKSAQDNGALGDLFSTAFRDLTVRLLKELLNAMETQSDFYSFDQITLFRALSPFRVSDPRVILLLNTWGAKPQTFSEDKYGSQTLLQQAEETGLRYEFNRVLDRACFWEFLAHPEFPKIYDSSHIWRAGLELPKSQISDGEVVSKGKAFFLRPEIDLLLKNARYSEIRKRIWAEFPAEN